MQETITAVFPSRDEAAQALGGLRQAGAVCHDFTLPAGSAGSATLHLMVRGADAPLARSIIRRAGGQM